MLTPSYTQSLSKYFQQSERFYYVIIDNEENFVYVNPLFQQQFSHITANFYGRKVVEFFPETASSKFKETMQECMQNPDCSYQLDLPVLPEAGFNLITKWEFTAYTNEQAVVENIQGIGFVVDEPGYSMPGIGHRVGKLAERYKAYEQGAEGLWRFELKEAISSTASPDEIIAHCRKHSFLAECNDNMARMYGYEKADELVGAGLEDLMDFDDPLRIGYLKDFIREGFIAAKVETKEHDRYGNTLYFLNNMEGVVENGMLKRIWGTQQDITEKRKMEEQLLQSELFFRNLFTNSLDGLLLTDEKGLITYASSSITPILGYSNDEVLGTNTFDYAHPDDKATAQAAFMNELAGQPTNKFLSVRLLQKSGEWIWCIIRGHNLMQNQYIKGMVVYFYDDTMRKQTEAALIESEQRFRYQANVLNNVTDVIVTTDMNRIVTSWNKVIEKLTGISEQDALGKPFRDVIETSYSPYSNAQVADIVFKEGIWRGEISFRGRSGETMFLLHTISILFGDDGRHIGLMGVGKDITERKKAEARLQESEQFYRSMSYHSLDGIVMSDNTGKITYCGPSVEKVSGYKPADLLGHNFFEFVHPDDMPAATEAFIKEVKKKSVFNYLFLRLKHSNSQWIWCTVRAHNLLDAPGFNSVVIYFTNDSKRKEAEDKLRESEEEYRNLINNLGQGVVVQNEKSEILVFNKAALDMLGLTKDQLLGRTSFDPRWDVIHEDGSLFPGDTHPVPVAIKTKKSVRDIVMGVFRPFTNNRIWLLVNAEPILGNNGNLINVICSFTDITEQKYLSQKLIEQEVQKQRLITQATIDGQENERQQIGKELHDNINQHLTTTRLYLEVASEKATGEALEMIRLSHKTLASITHEIRQLSQSLVPPTLGDIGLIESIQDLCDSLKRVHKFNVDFYSRHFSGEHLPDNLKLMIFRVTQEQVNNIVRHAEANLIQIKLESDAEFINLSLTDNGKGFDPAQTKKGQGFSNISNRAALFNARVEINSAPGKGCCLTVIIPVENIGEGNEI